MDFGSASSFFGETTFDLGLDNFGSGLDLLKPSSPNLGSHSAFDSFEEASGQDDREESRSSGEGLTSEGGERRSEGGERSSGSSFEKEEDPTLLYQQDSSLLSTTIIPLPQDLQRVPRPDRVALPESRPLSAFSMLVDEEGGPKSSTPNATFLRSHQQAPSNASSRSAKSGYMPYGEPYLCKEDKRLIALQMQTLKLDRVAEEIVLCQRQANYRTCSNIIPNLTST